MSTTYPRELKKGLDLRLGAVTHGHVAVKVQSSRVAAGQMLGQGCLGAERLGEKNRRYLGVEMFFQVSCCRGFCSPCSGSSHRHVWCREIASAGKNPLAAPPRSRSWACTVGGSVWGLEHCTEAVIASILSSSGILVLQSGVPKSWLS